MQIANVVRNIEEVEDIDRQLSTESASGSKKGNYKKRKVSTGDGNCSERTLRRRSAETYEAAELIQTVRRGHKRSCTIGMLETIEKKCEERELLNAFNAGKCKKLKEKVFPKVYKSAVKGNEFSTENMLRSVAVYYSNGVMGKVKYRSVYRASTYSFSTGRKKAVRMSVANCPIPRLVPYHRLVAYIKSVDAGKLYSVRGILCDGLDENDKVNGCYRDLEDLLVRLAQFYLNSDLYRILMFSETLFM